MVKNSKIRANQVVFKRGTRLFEAKQKVKHQFFNWWRGLKNNCKEIKKEKKWLPHNNPPLLLIHLLAQKTSGKEMKREKRNAPIPNKLPQIKQIFAE